MKTSNIFIALISLSLCLYGCSEKPVTFAASTGSKNALTGEIEFLDWESQAKPMIEEQRQKGTFLIAMTNSQNNAIRQDTVLGFEVSLDILKKLIIDTITDTYIDGLSGIYLMPAVRPCDLRNTKQYSTIMMGAIVKGKLQEDRLIDYFKPCPDKCENYFRDLIRVPNYSGYQADLCKQE